MRFAAGILALAMLSACATVPVQPVQLQNAFSDADFAWAKEKGTGAVEGGALLRTVGGDVKTCAGLRTLLIPQTELTSEVMTKIYGSDISGLSSSAPDFSGVTPEQIASVSRGAVCDAQGKFLFEGLPEGEYFAISEVTWGAVMGGRYAYTATQGGYLMQRLKVNSDQVTRVTLTSN